MSDQISSAQYTSVNQSIRNLHVKVNLLDFNFFIVNSIEGNVIDGNITIDANSDIRRTGNLTFVVKDSSFDVKSGGQIWLDKYVQIFIGIEDIRTSEIAWNNMGIFLINEPTYRYDATNRTMSFQCVDLMAKMTGLRNGYITGISSNSRVLIPVGSNVKSAIIGVLQQCGFNSYYISECKNVDDVIQEVPYDIEFDQGSTWYDVLSALRDILPNYQIYFDVNGVFRYEKIPSGENDPIMITDDLWKNNVLQENINVNFNDVKNVVEVWGRVHDTEYYSDSSSTTSSSGVIRPTWSGLNSLEDNVITALTLGTAVSNSNIRINFLNTTLSVKDFSNKNITSLPKNEYLVFSFDSSANCWRYLGFEQAYATWRDDNPDSPFYTNGSIGRIPIVLSGGDYENIISKDLALERAKYEIYRRCRLNDTLNLTTLPIYWADVNWKISYTPLSGERQTKEYMVQSITIPLGVTGTQSWTLSSFYPYYPII